ncbi:hypothetical protein COU77_03025 [Candidatus Peregrinibacteria bacterium CG10_big_fil_rev_8_21_14_0_10_49_16]|nr:MAG: hypothetical protein COW95_02540 [Candidatus Peregrinibacteria bacterium CG22_combo_CG10-13_8_21_14_all_49_11]PIR52006.1 MAG: hypothetical protein COU77_03025 [Candidatus Peregrinibacteria bacterium CG10_big_fil_rev_8_21_14_0_10_49_16]
MQWSSRNILPIAGACVLACLVIGTLWWELHTTTASLTAKLETQTSITPASTVQATILTSPSASQETAVFHLRKGDIFALQGEWSAAKKEYEEAVRKHGGIPALRKLAQAELQLRNISNVRNIVQQLRQEGAREEDILLLESIVLLRTGELTKVQNYMTHAPDSPHKQYILSLLALIQGKHEQAQSYLQQTAIGWEPTLRTYASIIQSAYDEYALFPESPPLHLTTLLSRALAQVQECELALPLLAQVVQQEENYRDAWIVQGYCELTTERVSEALISFERAYALDPQKPEVQYFLGRTYAGLGNTESAMTFYQYALKNGFSPEKEVRIRLAESAMQAKQFEDALLQYTTLLSGNDASPDLVASYVDVALQTGKLDEAYLLMQEAAVSWPNDAAVLAGLGEIALRLGKTEEAKKVLEKGLALDSTQKKIQELLREL